jgi:hypothetical protein
VRNFEACFHRDYRLLLGYCFEKSVIKAHEEESFTSFRPIKKYNGKAFFIDPMKRDMKNESFPQAQAKFHESLKNYSLVQEITL